MNRLKVFLLLLLAASPILSAQENQGSKISVPVAEAKLANEIEVYRYTGQIIPISTVNIVSRISADLMQVGFKEGDYVKEGQLLYTFDYTRYAATLNSYQA